jgi:hypothetical protein
MLNINITVLTPICFLSISPYLKLKVFKKETCMLVFCFQNNESYFESMNKRKEQGMQCLFIGICAYSDFVHVCLTFSDTTTG